VPFFVFTMLNFFAKYIDQIKRLLNKELELVKLKALRGFADVLSHAFLLVFITIFINTLVIIAAIWLGFVLSEALESAALGFGLSTLFVLLLLVLVMVFRKPLIVNPFRNALMSFYLQTQEQTEESLTAPPKSTI